MTRTEPQNAAADTAAPSEGTPAATGAGETEVEVKAGDSDTKRGTKPKGSGLVAKRKSGAPRLRNGGGSDTGGSGGPKTGLLAKRKTGRGEPGTAGAKAK